jgi:hypothetical protein
MIDRPHLTAQFDRSRGAADRRHFAMFDGLPRVPKPHRFERAAP